MAIQLDQILADIAKEKALHPNNGGSSKQEQDEAWARIGRKNKLSVHESRSIFIVLQKKYRQEKAKGNSTWKLFDLMHEIHQEPSVLPKPDPEDEQLPMDEEEYEMLEVQEQEEDEDSAAGGFAHPTASSTGSASSDGESPSKSHGTGSPEKEEQPKTYAKTIIDTPRPNFEEKKLLNTMAPNTTPRPQSSSISMAAAVLQGKKGITLKKTPGSSVSLKSLPVSQSLPHKKTAGLTTIQLPDSLKRKLTEEYPPPQKKVAKTSNPSHVSPKQAVAAPKMPSPTPAAVPAAPVAPVVHTTTAQLLQVKKEREGNQSPPPGINIITIPAANAPLINGNMAAAAPTSSTAATVASTSTNGFSPHTEELDLKNDIVFDAGCTKNNGNGNGKNGVALPEVINLGNFDNSLPPTFFKNLCNSSRHEALGLYVANVMNRISHRAAAKLELGILRAILDVQSDELEQ